MEYSSVNLDERIFRLRNSYGDVKTFIGKVAALLLLVGVGCWIYSYTEESTNFIVYGNLLTALFIPAILLYFGIDDVERAALNRLKRKYAKEVEKIKKARTSCLFIDIFTFIFTLLHILYIQYYYFYFFQP